MYKAQPCVKNGHCSQVCQFWPSLQEVSYFMQIGESGEEDKEKEVICALLKCCIVVSAVLVVARGDPSKGRENARE